MIWFHIAVGLILKMLWNVLFIINFWEVCWNNHY